jgi:hypothetical protein
MTASKTSTQRLRIIVLGYFVRGPLGGMVWSNLQYVMGLSRLGHDVYFVEDSGESPWCCYDPTTHNTSTDPTYGLRFAEQTFSRVGLGDRWAYYDAHMSRWFGPCVDKILTICASADLVLNLAGMNPLRSWLIDIPVRVYIDEDPAFTQIRHLIDSVAQDLALQHTTFFSFAENIGRSQCTIPNDGFPWQTTRQPVILDLLSATRGPPQGKFTTVMLWDSYAPQEYQGVKYGMKSESFTSYLDLPKKVGPILELAVGGPTAPVDLLRSQGWALRNPVELTRDPWTYQQYIQESKAEFSVAKHGYVISRSGWFSERSVTYLASGRPVVIQETGFSNWLEAGAGVISFATPEEALAGIEEVKSRYEHHCRAAREVAEEYFDARKILPVLIERAMHVTSSQVL